MARRTGATATAHPREVVDRRRLRAIAAAIILLGLWGGSIGFWGPAVGWMMGPEPAWTWSGQNVTLHFAAGLGTVVGGLGLLLPNRRVAAAFGWLALLSGAWFLFGMVLQTLWLDVSPGGASIPIKFAFHFGPGVLITALAAYALGLLRTPAPAPAREDRVEPRRESVAAR